jgi:hypothetical protein
MLKQLQLGTVHNDLTKICKPVPKYGTETRDYRAETDKSRAETARTRIETENYRAEIARFCAGIQCGTGVFCA